MKRRGFTLLETLVALAVTALVLAALAYGVERDALVRRETSRFAPADAASPAPIVLLEGVRRFRIRCFDGSEWTDAWQVAPLPRAVEIALTTDDGRGGADELATAVALPRGRDD